MGVSAVHYVVLGVNLGNTKEFEKLVKDKSNPWNEFLEKYTEEEVKKYGEPEIDHDKLMEFFPEKGLELIYDGMNGKYVIVGNVLAKSSESRWSDGCFEGMTVFDDFDELICKTKNIFFMLPMLEDKGADIKLYIFTYYH